MKEERLTRQEIESRIQGMGDYVVMDYLAGCLRKSIDFDTKNIVNFCCMLRYGQRW